MSLKAIKGKIESQELNDNFSYLDSTIRNIDKGSPKGVFDTVQQLKDAYPSGDSGIYIVGDSWYFWDGGDWVRGGVYQAQGLGDGSVAPPKTTFFTFSDKNLFDGSLTYGYTYFNESDGPGSVRASSTPNSYIGIVEIENGKTYTVTKFEGGNRFNVMLTNTIPTPSAKASLVAPIHQGNQSSAKQVYTLTNSVNAKYVIVQTNFNEPNTPLLQVEEGSQSTDYEPGAFISRDFLSELRDGEVEPKKTSFFRKSEKNLFDGYFTSGLVYFRTPTGQPDEVRITSTDGVYAAVIEIEDDESYIITKLNGGNRFNVMLTDNLPTSNNPSILKLDVWRGDFTSSEQTYNFVNNVKAKYVIVQTNYNSHDLPRLQIEKGVIQSPYEPGLYIPKQFIEPDDEKDQTADYRFNFPVNLYSLYRKQNDIENYIEDPGELTVEEYHTMFNDLVSQHTEIAKRTKLGDVTGDFPLYLYEIKPPTYWVDYENDSGGTGGRPSPLPKITMVTGIHGHERSPSISAFYAFKELLENPEDNELIDFVKMNVHFECIALANPSGWTDGTYENRNNVNLNRQFPPFVETPTESEAILIKNHLDSANMDFFIDFHNMYFRDGYIGYTLSSSDVFKYSMNNVYRDLGRSWSKQYSQMPQEIDHVWGYNSIPNNGTVANYVQTQLGVESALMEIIRTNSWLGGGSFSEPIARMGVELIVNAIASALRTK